MSVNLIDGHAGTAHVTARDDGAVNAGIIGNGKYVFNVGEKFAYETISNNLIRIKDGYMINQGRRIGIKVNDYEDVTIDNGLQSVKRSDLIVMRYTKNADTGIETAEVVVIKGTSGDSYVDPEHTTGDILNGDLVDDVLLYRVNLDGLTITSVTALFTISNTMKELETDINTNKADIANNTTSITENTSELENKQDLCKNLLPISYKTQAIQGVTFTVNTNGSVSGSGTAEYPIDYYFHQGAISTLESGKSYIVTSLDTTHIIDVYMGVTITRAGTPTTYYDYGSGIGIQFTYISGDLVDIYIHASTDSTINSSFYPMIRKAEITDSTYEQYYPTLKELNTNLANVNTDLLQIPFTAKTTSASEVAISVPVVLESGTYYVSIRQSSTYASFPIHILPINRFISGSGSLVFTITPSTTINFTSGSSSQRVFLDNPIYEGIEILRLK